MMTITRFVQNYTDQSTENGFQFEFFCDRCSTGYQTPFVAADSQALKEILYAAGSMFGGVFHMMANLADQRRSVEWEKAHDAAFQQAIESVRSYFNQCRKCSRWVDNACFHATRSYCKDCLEELEADAPKKPRKKTKTSAKATCPSCDSPVKSNAKFCTECGTQLNSRNICSACGTAGSGKFCAECGTPL